MHRFLKLCLIASVLVFAAPVMVPATGPSASAAELTFQIRSTYPYRLFLKFYGQKWNHVWPADGKVYVLGDSKLQRFTLWCRSGDRICYGAWVTTDESIYWGVGPDDTHGCKGCCFACVNGRTDPITLTR